MKNTKRSKSQNGFSPLFIVIGVVVLIGIGLFVAKGGLNKVTVSNQQTTNQKPAQESTQTDSGLKSIFSSIEGTYNGSIPWTNIKNKVAYQFYPTELKGLTLPHVSTNYDNNYNPLTVFKLTDTSSIPLKNSYISYYEVPDVLRDKFKLSDTDIALPIELKVYEFDRQLNETEKSTILRELT